MKQILFLLAACMSLALHAQNQSYSKTKKQFPLKAQVEFGKLQSFAETSLEKIDAPMPGGSSYKDYLEEVKNLMSKQFPKNQIQKGVNQKKSTANSPQQLRNFGALMHHPNSIFFDSSFVPGGNPSDHTLAVSNDGKLMVGYNTSFWAYDLDADTAIFKPNVHFTTLSFGAIVQGSGVSLNSPFDPKLLYDPIEDRFVFLFLSGRGPSDSKIVVGFSQTNNPALGWNIYEIDGNPNDVNQWTDYPAMALTEGELFITVNLLRAGEPWETGFAETIVWQIDKFDGFDGNAEINTVLWNDIMYNNQPLRYFRPIQDGFEPKGPNCYFISNRSIPQVVDTVVLLNDSIFLIEITGEIDNPNAALQVKVGKANNVYGTPPNAKQANNFTLNTNDSRVLGGFYENGEIQFVGNTIDTLTGLAAIYHGYITNLNASEVDVDLRIITGKELNGEVLELGYPNIASTGNGAALIAFNHTSEANFAGHSCIYVAPDYTYSDQIILKEGLDYVNRIPGNNERWGDYSGIQRKYNEPTHVWAAGYFGIPATRHTAWISEIEVPSSTPAGTEFSPISLMNQEPVIFPNPASSYATLTFYAEKSEYMYFELYDLNGRLIKVLNQDYVNKGNYRYQIHQIDVASGTYLLQIRTAEKSIKQEKFVVVK